MNRRRNTIIISTLSLILLGVMAAWAHGGFDHVIGTVTKIDNNVLTVHTTKGDVDVKLNDQTEITKSDQKAGLADLKPGSRVIVDIPEGSKDKVAHSVKVGVAKAAAGTHADAHEGHEAH